MAIGNDLRALLGERFVSRRKLGAIARKTNRMEPATRVELETLESRVMLSTATWVGANSGNWNDTANWVVNNGVDPEGPGVPTTGDDLVFNDAAATKTLVNDLTAGTSFGSISITGSGYSVSGNSLTTTLGINANYNGTGEWLTDITLADNTISVGSGATFDIGGKISGSLGLSKQGNGTLGLSGANDYSGATGISSGTIVAKSNAALGADSDATNLADDGVLQLSGGITSNESISLTPSSIANLVNLDGSNTITGTVTMNGDATIDVIAGTLTLSDTLVGDVGDSFAKTGAGTLKLANGASYGSDTDVAAGTLIVGDTLSSSLVTVDGGATLAGKGPVGAVDGSGGGNISPGESTAILETGSLTLDADSSVTLEINGTTAGTGHDQVDVTGTVTLGDATLNITLGYTTTPGDVITIINNDGVDAVSGTFAGLPEGGLITAGGPNSTFRISYTGGSGNDVTLTAVQDSTTVVNSTAAPSVFGQSIDLTATITVGTGTATGTVEFFDGGNSLGTVAVDGSGVATLTTSALSVDDHIISAVYSGDGVTVPSTSSDFTQTVNRASTGTSLNSDINPSTYGQSVTLTATVTATAPGGGTPTGTVSFFDGLTLLGTSSLDGSGVATLAVSTLSAATHSLSASYSGSDSFDESDSADFDQTVNAATTSVVVGSSNLASVFGESVTFTATVSVDAPGVGPAVGSVEFFDGVTSLGTATLNGSGEATLSTSLLSVASHTVTAQYLGNGNFTGSTSTDISQVVSQASSTTSLGAVANPSVFGESVTLTATVAAVAPSGAVPAGSVEFFDGVTSLGTASLTDGVATLTTSALSVASHDLTAQYLGTAEVAGSTSSITSQVVNQASTTVALQSSANPTNGSSVTITATVAAVAPGAGTPTGNIEFFVDGVSQGVTALDGSGQATLTLNSLTESTFDVTATYAGDTNFTTSTSGTLTQVVDTTAPDAPVVAAISSDNGTSSSDGLTNDTTLVFSGTAEPNSSVQVFIDGVSLGSITANGSGGWSLDHTGTTLAEGTYAITAQATDAAGNTSVESAAFTVTIDTSAPAAPSVASVSTDSGSSNSDGITSDNTVVISGTATAGATVDVKIDSASIGTVVADIDGNWSIDHTGTTLADGVYSVTASVSDDAGNTATSGAFTLTVDTTPPAAPVVTGVADDTGASATDGLTTDGSLVVSGTAEAGASVEVFRDAASVGTTTADGSGNWSLDLTAETLTEGVYAFTAVATDGAGNVGSASEAFQVTVDATPPAAPSTPDLAAASDSGSSDTDNLTNLTELTLTGTADAGTTVEIFDGVTSLGQVAAPEGNWSFTTGTLTEGDHSFTAVATDAAGNASTASGALDVTIDLTAPASPSAPDLADASDSGASNTDNVTSLTTPTFTGNAEANILVTLFDGATPIGSATADGDGNWSITASALAEGDHTITATATDAAGNQSAAGASLVVTIDTTAPDAPSITSSIDDTGSSNSDGVTNDVTQTLSGVAEANSTVTILDGENTLGTTTADGSGNWTYTTPELADGSHTLTATATDAAGNVSVASAGLTVTIDTATPAAPVIVTIADDTGGITSDGITTDSTLIVAGTAEAGASIELSIDGNPVGSANAGESGNWIIDITGTPLAEGTYQLTATATDLAGNVSVVSSAFQVVIDNSAPAAPSAPDLADASDTGTSNTDDLTNDTTPTLTGTAEAGAIVTILDGTDPVGSGVADESGNWSVTTSALADGEHTLSAVATDAAGNESSAGSALTITIDATAPASPVITGITDDTGSSATDGVTTDGSLVVSGTAVAGSTVVLLNGETLAALVTADIDGNWSADLTGETLAAGSYTFTATAGDSAGNTSASSEAFVVVVDNSAPTASGTFSSATLGATTYTFTVVFSDNVAIDVASLDGSDITVTGPNSFTADAVFVSVDSNSNGTPRTATYSIVAPGGTWDSADAGTYTISLNASQVSDTAGNLADGATLGTFFVNVPPDAGDDAYSVNEDGSLVVNAINGVLSNDTDANLDTLTATLVDAPSHGTIDFHANGSFTYTPAANYNGSDTFTYRANDGSVDSNLATVTLTVASVNDEPSFTNGSNVKVNSAATATAQSVTNFITNISAGPLNESGQTLTFGVTNSNNALFAVQPAISSTGTLTFTPAAGATGIATVSVSLQDNGGTTNGGDDTSSTQTFTITVASQFGTVGGKKGVKAVLTDTDGSKITFALSGLGTAEVYLDGNRYVINLSDTTDGSTLTVTTSGGDGISLLGPITVTTPNASLGGISAKASNLLNGLTVPGTLKTLTVRDLAGNVSVGVVDVNKNTLTINAQLIGEANIDSDTAIKSLTAFEWVDNSGPADVLAAPSLGTLSIKGNKGRALVGDFEADVILSDATKTLSSVKVAGTVRESTIRTPGSIGTFSAAAAEDSRVYAGFNANPADALPTAGELSGNVATIKSYEVTGKGLAANAKAFINSVASAGTITKVTLRDVNITAGQNDFGVAAGKLGSYTRLTKNFALFKFSNALVSDLDAANDDLEVLPGEISSGDDFVVRIA